MRARATTLGAHLSCTYNGSTPTRLSAYRTPRDLVAGGGGGFLGRAVFAVPLTLFLSSTTDSHPYRWSAGGTTFMGSWATAAPLLPTPRRCVCWAYPRATSRPSRSVERIRAPSSTGATETKAATRTALSGAGALTPTGAWRWHEQQQVYSGQGHEPRRQHHVGRGGLHGHVCRHRAGKR